MKKQLFILIAIALLTVGFNSTYGQIVPRAVTCLDPNDVLHPIPGTDYDYTIAVPGTWSGGIHYRWFVTQDPNFITLVGGVPTITSNISPDGSFFDVDGTAGSAYNLNYPPIGGSPNINITWHSAGWDRTIPIFLAIMVVGDDGVCTPNNIKVYKIQPLFAFTLDIDNLLADGSNSTPTTYGDNIGICISDIQSAVYDATNDEVDYDFGENALYFEVIAANWFDRWELSTRLAGLNADQTAQIDWAYAPAARPIDYTTLSWTAVAPAGSSNGDYTSTTLVEIQGGATSVDAEGQSIIIRVIVDHGNRFEGTVTTPVTLAVDGVLAHLVSGIWTVSDPAIEGDIHYAADGSGNCPWFDSFTNDISAQTIAVRPTINSVSPPPTGYLPIGN